MNKKQQIPLNDNNGIAPCIRASYFKAGYKNFVGGGRDNDSFREIAVMEIWTRD